MRSLLALIAAVVLLAGSANALCGVPQPRLVCAEYFQKQAVVTARLVSIRHFAPKDRDDYYLFTMETEQVLRGRIPQRFRVIEENNSGRTGIDWNRGDSYLLFTSYAAAERTWSLESCGNSGRLSESEHVLQEIRELRNPGRGGTIQGLVRFDPNATVLIRGIHRDLKVTAQTNQDGEFKANVPSGSYTAWPTHKGMQFEVDLMSYENPRKIKMENGRCAQMQFNALERKK